MKLDEIKDLSVEELTAQLAEKGINERRLNGAMESNYLPKNGTFDRFEVKGENGFEHVRLYTKTGESISLSRLQARGFIMPENQTELTETDYTESQSNGFFLRSNFVVNPSLQGNQAAIIKKLIGKSFKAELVEYITTKYNENGYDSVDEVVTQNQESYVLTIK